METSRKARVAAHPYVLLTLCVAFWSGNFIVARAVVGDMPPMALSFWRWAIASLILLPFAVGPMRRNRGLLRANLGRMLVLAALGVTTFNSLVYVGLQDTTAINGLLLQSSMPLMIIALGRFLYRQPVSALEAGSVMLSLFGVMLILGRGEPGRLLQGDWTGGDLWILAAVLIWALYSLFLRWRPPGLEALAFLGFTLCSGALMILPLWLFELSHGVYPAVNLTNLSAVMYVAVFPSVLSYLFWNRGVEALGANTAGHFIHLNPVFGSLLAVALLGERFAWYHAAGGGLVALSIVTVALSRSR
jgi:drug/metabolite transporter (DMT)-like permease